MAGSVIKMLNFQYPNIEVHFSTYASTEFIRSAMGSTDVAFKWVDVDPFTGPLSEYQYVTGHMIYSPTQKVRGLHFIHGMVETFNKNTGLELAYQPEVFAKTVRDKRVPTPLQPYVVMPATGRVVQSSWAGKEWGVDNFQELANLLSEHYAIVQVGSDGDPDLECATVRYKGCSAEEVSYLLRGSALYVGIVNGLCVLAGQNNVKAYVVYCGGAESPKFSLFPRQVPIVGTNIKPLEVYQVIAEAECL